MPIAVKVFKPATESSSETRPSAYVRNHAIRYEAIMGLSQKVIKDCIAYWQKKEDELNLSGRMDEQTQLDRKVIRLNLRRFVKRYHAVFKKLPDPKSMPVDTAGKTFRCVSPLPWRDESRIEEELFLKARDKRLAELVRLVRSDDMVKIEIVFRDDGAYFEFLKERQVVKEERVAELMTISEAREILRAGTESFLGRAFRALISRSSWK